MEFWRWLSSKDGLPVLVAIIGLLGTVVAVGATIATQLLTVKATADRETAKLNFDKQRWEAEQEAGARSRFEDVKREAFVGYLQAAVHIEHLLSLFSRYRWEFFVSRSERRRMFNADQTLTNRAIELRLIAPETRTETGAVSGQVAKMLSLMLVPGYKEHRLHDEEVQLLELIRAARQAMQRSLGIEVDADEGNIADSLEGDSAWKKEILTEFLQKGRIGPNSDSD